jgi:nucleoside-diphosphate-sugar epimerase
VKCLLEPREWILKHVLVTGAGGFIGSHLVRRLKQEGCQDRGIVLKEPKFSTSEADVFILGDLRDPAIAAKVCMGIDDIYQFAADMGGAGYIFTGKHTGK